MALITVPTTAKTHEDDMCEYSDKLTFVTANPDETKSTEGVSLKNALFNNKTSAEEEVPYTPTIDEILADDYVQHDDYHWYFLRVNYCRAEKLYKQLKEKKEGYLLWMPCQKHVKYENGMKMESLAPIFKSNLFVYSTYEQAFSLTHRAPSTGYDYVDFAYDHTSHNQYGRDYVITIPFNEMRRFIKAEHIHHPWACVVEKEHIHFRPGGLVRVNGGSFEGVEGYVARVFGQTRVVVTIKGIVNYATAYISQKYLQPIEETEEKEEKKLEAGNSIRQRITRHELKVGTYIPVKIDSRKKRKV